MTACYSLPFTSKPYGFRIVGDDQNKNAIVKAILNPTLAKSLYVGSWITQINDIVVETWDFSKIIQILRDAQLPVNIKFKQCLILCGTDKQLISHQFTPNLNIEVFDTGKEPSQQKQGKPFVAYNLFINDLNGRLKWQLWKRYNQFEQLHKQLVRIVPDLSATLPPKQHFGRFKPGFIQQRRVQLQKYVNDIKHHPAIVNSNEFRNFLIPMSFNQPMSSKQNFKYNNPSEMKPILLEIRDRLETLCDSVEMNTISRDNILSSVRYLLSLVNDTCSRTRDPMDATTVSRNFTTGLPNNNAFIKSVDQIFYGKYSVNNNNNNNNDNIDNNINDDDNNNNNDDDDININDDDIALTGNNDNTDADILKWGLLLIDADDFTSLLRDLTDTTDEIEGKLLLHLSQIIYSCITNEHQKVFHLNSDQFGIITPIDAPDDVQRLAATILTKIRSASLKIDIDPTYIPPDNDNNNNKPDKSNKSDKSDPLTSSDNNIIYIKQNKLNFNKKRAHIVWDLLNNQCSVFMTVSIGLSVLKNKNQNNNSKTPVILDISPADWIQRADLSLQRAKKKSKNCIGPLLEHFSRAQDFRNDITSQWFSAASIGQHSRILEMVKTGFNVDTLQISYDSDTKLTALMTAAIYNHSSVARTLLRYNADINLRDEYGRTSLMHAAQNGSYETCQVLLKSGRVLINCGDKTHRTALMYASLRKNIRIIELLLEYNAEINRQDQQGLTALMLSIQNSSSCFSLKIVSILLNAHPDLTLQDEFGQTALHFASLKNYYNITARMIQSGAQINCQNQNGLTSLMWASWLGNEEVVNVLLQYNCDIYLKTQHSTNSLLFASESGYYKIIQKLLKYHNNHSTSTNNNNSLIFEFINHTDNDGDTAIHASSHNGHIDCVKLLIKNGANINIKNKNGKLPIDYAIQNGHQNVIKYLKSIKNNNDK